MSSSDRANMRQFFFDAWKKHQQKHILEPLEANIVAIILAHPEYHDVLQQTDPLEQDHVDGENPFLHMGLHLALHEQITTNRPAGIQAMYNHLWQKLGERHAAEHRMMDALASVLWNAQQTGVAPDETHYLELLQKL